MKNNRTTQLNQAYYKNFKNLSKHFFDNKETGLIFFIEYLRYMRDYLAVTSADLDLEAIKIKLATLAAAVAEVDAYIIEQDSAKKLFHWNNFCELVKLNMEEWLKPNDSV